MIFLKDDCPIDPVSCHILLLCFFSSPFIFARKLKEYSRVKSTPTPFVDANDYDIKLCLKGKKHGLLRTLEKGHRTIFVASP